MRFGADEFTADLIRLLARGGEGSAAYCHPDDIECRTVFVAMRDGARLATDLYLPPKQPAPIVVIRTPYSRAADHLVGLFMAFARRGYTVVAHDCRGTGDSEPDNWDYYVFEAQDGYDLIEWIARQEWYGGFIGSCGSSYAGQTQWSMATHPAMTAIAPHVSGLGFATNTARLHLFANGYARTVGKGPGRLVGVNFTEIERLIESETLSTGFYDEPLHRPLPRSLELRFPEVRGMGPTDAERHLWERYCTLDGAGRAEFIKLAMGTDQVGLTEIEAIGELFGHRIAHDAHSLPTPNDVERCRLIRAPALMVTGWYDWGLNDALATWVLLRRQGRPEVAERSRLIVTPHAHNTLGYHEGIDAHPELQLPPTIVTHAGVLLRWYRAIREGAIDDWPRVLYYLMGANEWRVADEWPVPGTMSVVWYLGSDGSLTAEPPNEPAAPDRYSYNPLTPTPTVGGSIVSYQYPVGSVDVSHVQRRSDVLMYTTAPFECDCDVVGPLRLVLYASSSALDTDFAARVSDVFPDGRAIQLQHCILRARYRGAEPELLEPGRIYRFEIDLWATANRFKAGHRLRVDISSADFPRYDRNSNRGGTGGPAVVAQQAIYRDPEHPSHLMVSILESRRGA